MQVHYQPLTLVIVLGAPSTNKLKCSEADYLHIQHDQTLLDYRLRNSLAGQHQKHLEVGKKTTELNDHLLSQYRFIVFLVGFFDAEKMQSYLLSPGYNQTSYSLIAPLPFMYAKVKAQVTPQAGSRQLLVQAHSEAATWNFSAEFANIHQYLAESMVCACVEDIQYAMYPAREANTFSAYFHAPSQIVEVVHHLKQRLSDTNEPKGHLLAFYHDHQCRLNNYALLCEALNQQCSIESIQTEVVNMPKDRNTAGKRSSKVVFLYLRH